LNGGKLKPSIYPVANTGVENSTKKGGKVEKNKHSSITDKNLRAKTGRTGMLATAIREKNRKKKQP